MKPTDITDGRALSFSPCALRRNFPVRFGRNARIALVER